MSDKKTELTKEQEGCAYCLLGACVLTCRAIAFDYALTSIVGKAIPWYGDVVGGFVGWKFTIPVGLICWLLRLCGVDAPFWNIGG